MTLVSGDGPTELETIGVDGLNRTTITDNGVDDWYPDWRILRPDASDPALIGAGHDAHLAFVIEGDLYTVPVDLAGTSPAFDLTELERVYDSNQNVWPDAVDPTWKPDATKIAFGTTGDSGGEIFIQDLPATDTPTG